MSASIPDPLESAAQLYERGRTAMDAGDFPAAIEHFRGSVSAAPHFKTLELLGECLLRVGKASEAVVFLASAAGLGNKQARPYFLLAQALLQIGEREAAAEKLREALTLNANYKSARELLLELEG